MIFLDFNLAIALYLFGSIGILLLFWLFARKQKEKEFLLDPKYTWYCSVCTYTYINTKEELISVCPRCGSYNKQGEASSSAPKKDAPEKLSQKKV